MYAVGHLALGYLSGPVNTRPRTSRTNALCDSFLSTLPSNLHTLQEKSHTLLFGTDPAQPHRRLPNRHHANTMAHNHQLVWSRHGDNKPNQHPHRMGPLPYIHRNTVQDKRRVATAPKAPVKHDPSNTSPNGSPTHPPKLPPIRLPGTDHPPHHLHGSLLSLHSHRSEDNLHENMNLTETRAQRRKDQKPFDNLLISLLR